MRKLMWFAIGFTAACAAGVYALGGQWLLLAAIFSLLGVTSWFLKTDNSRRAALVMLGCTIGFCWVFGFDSFYLKDVQCLDGKVVDLSIEATDYCYETSYGVAGDGKITVNDKEYSLRYYLSQQYNIQPGDRIAGEFRLRLTSDGGQDTPTYHRGKGIFLLAYDREKVSHMPAGEIPLIFRPAWLRKQITSLIDATFPADTLGFARALLLGDSSQLDYETDTDLKLSGIRHVIAVSGLHVSILFSLVYMFCRKRRFLTAMIGIPVLVLFAAVAGFSPSIVRACTMQAVMILAMLLNREYDPPTGLSAAVVLLLAVNPQTVTSVSFQLSVGSMAGIFLFSQRISGYLLSNTRTGGAVGNSMIAKLKRWLVGSVAVTLSAMVITVPLCACYFGVVSIIGILTNLLTLWIISFIFYGIMIACVLGAIWLPAGQVIGWLISWLMRYVLQTAKVCADVPFGAVYTQSDYITAWLVISYLLLASFLLCRQKRLSLLFGSIILSFVLTVTFSCIEPQMDNYRVYVLDVGQGQCLLVQSKGKNYIVDCGSERSHSAADIAAQTLLSQGVSKLDGLILTHYDADHAGDVHPLLTRIDTDAIYMPAYEDDNGITAQLEAEYPQLIHWVDSDRVLEDKNVKISLFFTEKMGSDNESSMCILFQVENCDILITGDRSDAGERKLLRQTKLPDLEVLVVGHHGSKTSTSLELLNATQPDYALISVSAENKYGHPSQEVLNRLRSFGCRILRTDEQGTIIIRG